MTETHRSRLLRLAKQVHASLPDFASLRVAGVGVGIAIALVFGLRSLGGLEPLELGYYDWLMRSRPHREPDSRLLIISVTEADLRTLQRWPATDIILARLIQRLQAHEPHSIGLDIYRDFPIAPGSSEFATQLQQPNVFTIRNIDTLVGTPAPPASPAAQVGFNELPFDADGVVRRQILFAEAEDGALFSFALQLALPYLASREIVPQGSTENPEWLQLGAATFVPLTPDAGGYHNVEADGYQVLLDYRAPQEIAPTISLTQALFGYLDPERVRGKVVLIGSVAPSLRDNFFTPFSSAARTSPRLPGVLIHAQIVSQLLDAATGERSLLWFWSERLERLWIAAWILWGGLVGWRLRHPLVLTLTIGISLLLLSAASLLLFLQAGWIPFAAPALGLIVTTGFVVSYQSYENYRQQQIVMRLLGQNTSPEIAEALWKGRDNLLKAGRLPGIRLVATTLFLDIRGFSTISEKMSPEVLLCWLNELFAEVTGEVLSRQGIINKFTGDGLMAVFGVPLSRIHKSEVGQDAGRAVDCALAIARNLQSLNQDWPQRGFPQMQMRIGIFTGPAIVGSVGGKDRLEYGVLGDSVNTAARLENCEKHRQPDDCRILIARETLLYLGDRYQVESWGPIALKGKEQMIEVYRILGAAPE
ncbi:MAG: adenylate/guanylate cyclase domain-containing protein [Spirulinaceae cyanobacterium SM2_1_0]|nr:adenylate/guanylate cyclase domain-containing protein [Spirulinaceae cyanobacterium SM2_1_0]